MPQFFPPITVSTATLVLDLLGTFVFALSGAVSGVKHRLDIFGVLALSFAAANVGGITRDLLIGAVPPPGIADWRYIAVALAAGLLTFYGGAVIERLWNSVLLFDAVGLGLFAVTGASKALAYHLPPLTAVLLGVLTGVGGGMARDILVSEVPVVLRADLYAVAALAGAAVVVTGRALGLAGDVASVIGAALCIGVRIMAMRRHWQLPVARPRGGA
ncbi:MAG TPA: TRIC cation channel family protein [Gemmatimonadaceae bacterium]|nr:TRIC cation channel family protein [Gemmatimonadaceae bacterium]